MSAVPGSDSIRRLFDALQAEFGAEAIRWVGEPGNEVDAIGWRLEDRPRFLFSVSTHAGGLPLEVYDLQVSIADDSMENGDIVLLDEMDLQAVCETVAQFQADEAV